MLLEGVYLFTLIVVNFCISRVHAAGDILLPAVRLRTELLKNYHKVVRPVLEERDITKVHYKAWLYELVSIDPKSQTINMLMFELLQWYDELLTWDPANYYDQESVRFERTEIWTPDILPYNDVGGFDKASYDSIVPIDVLSNGVVWWMKPFDYKTTCSLDVTNFPFDTQRCEVTIGSWHYLSHEIEMVCFFWHSWDSTICNMQALCDSEYLVDNLWSLESTGCSHVETNGTRGVYSTLVLSVTFKRLSTFYVKNLIIPHILILFLSTLIFFIPGETGEKIGFGITVTLTIVVNLSIVAEFLPHSSTGYPKLYQFYLCSIILSGFSLVLSTISVNFVYPGYQKQKAEQGANINMCCRCVANRDGEQRSAAPTSLIEINLDTEQDNPLGFRAKLIALKQWIIDQWKNKMTRRTLDVAIGLVYFLVVLLYTAIFFSSLK